MSGLVGRRKRLLVVSPSLSGGGAERFASTLLCHLDRDRFDLYLCLMRDEVTYPLPDDISTSVVMKDRPWHIPRAIMVLRRVIRRQRPDVILSVMESVAWLVQAAMTGIHPRPRHVARFAISPHFPQPKLEAPIRPVVTALLRKADLCVSSSPGMREDMVSAFRIAPTAVISIPNPVNIELLERAAADARPERTEDELVRLIFVGRLATQKRPDLLLESFSRARRHARARLRICGDGPLRARVEEWIRRLAVAEDVDVLGFVENPYGLVSSSDVFVLTSDYEGMPNALIEAQALGLPAVSTRCPTGPDEIIEQDVTGLLVPVGDVDAITAAILRLASDGEMRGRMGAAARERARALFDHRAIVARWEDVLDSLE